MKIKKKISKLRTVVIYEIFKILISYENFKIFQSIPNMSFFFEKQKTFEH